MRSWPGCLSCVSPLGWLNRMTQFKEKAGKDRENAPVGLYTYPVLMAADILAYQATHVPVGEDQKQHLELARDIAGSFNRRFGVELFPLPEPMILGEATRVMSLRDGTKKMSKSDPSEQSRISLTDDADTIALKFRRAKSDSILGISYDPENRPEASNLLTIFAALAERPRAEVEAASTPEPPSPTSRAIWPTSRSRSWRPSPARCAASRPTPATSTASCATVPSARRRMAEQVLAQAYDAVGFLRPLALSRREYRLPRPLSRLPRGDRDPVVDGMPAWPLPTTN